MGGVTLVLDMDGHGLSRGLDELQARLLDVSQALETAGTAMLSSVRENFRGQGRPEKWKPLEPETIERKGHGIILYETGRLMASIVYRAENDALTISTPLPYARVQQSGDDALPARPFLVFQQEDASVIKSFIEGYIVRGNP